LKEQLIKKDQAFGSLIKLQLTLLNSLMPKM